MSANASPSLMCLPQLMSAKKKIGRIAAFYDPKKISLTGFDSVSLDPTQFREQLRRNLDVKLTDSELGALVLLFDKNGDGFVDSAEFKNEFFRLGKQELDKFNIRKKEEKERVENFKNTLALRRQEALAKFSKTKISDTWTPSEERNALKKIANIAYTYDPLKGGLEAFQMSPTIPAVAFRVLMRSKFEVYFSAEETGALVNMFSRDDDSVPFEERCIDCKDFLYQFFNIGRQEREFHFRKQKALTEKYTTQEKQRVSAAKERFAKQVVAKRGEASEQDKKVVYEKIRKAATYFKGDSVFSSNLWKSFESAELDPTEFKELLKTNFDIYLSPNELDAAIKLFDTDGNGDISSIEFITTFFRIALKERSKRLEEKRRQDEEIRLAKEERIRILKEEQIKKNQTKIIWPDLPEIEYKRNPDGTAISTNDGLPEVNSKRKKISKPSVKEIISPSKSGTELRKGESLVTRFPAASDPTKDFIVELERREREVAKLKPNSIYSTIGSKSKKGKKKKKQNTANSVDYSDGNLEDATWGGNYYMEDSKGPNMFAGDDFGTRPGTSANSSRGGASRGGERTRPNTEGLTGLDSNSIVEEVGEHSTEDVADEVS